SLHGSRLPEARRALARGGRRADPGWVRPVGRTPLNGRAARQTVARGSGWAGGGRACKTHLRSGRPAGAARRGRRGPVQRPADPAASAATAASGRSVTAGPSLPLRSTAETTTSRNGASPVSATRVCAAGTTSTVQRLPRRARTTPSRGGPPGPAASDRAEPSAESVTRGAPGAVRGSHGDGGTSAG